MNSVHLTCCIHGKHTRLPLRCRESAYSLNLLAGLAASFVRIIENGHEIKNCGRSRTDTIVEAF